MAHLAASIVAIAVALTHPAPAHLHAGAGMGAISIPRIGLKQPLTQGSAALYTADWPTELDRGPAHYANTALPWQRGVTAFAGHRTTFTHPFRKINRLRRGDAVILTTRWGTFRYRVRHVFRVDPHNLKVLGFIRKNGRWFENPHPEGHTLTLTACDPPGRATYRIVVEAVLAHVTRAA